MINHAGVDIPVIRGYEDKALYAGPFAVRPSGRKAPMPLKFALPGKQKVVKDIDAAIEAVELRDGMTISFHHALRNGDRVMQLVVGAIARKGISNLTLSASSLSLVQDALLPYLEQGVITRIDTSGARGQLGNFIQQGRLAAPAVFRTHGGRARAIETGELHIDVAFLAAPTCDSNGNINGIEGISACGSLGYAKVDAAYADRVVAVTDHLVDHSLSYISIPQTQVDYIVEVDSIGDPAGIATGSLRARSNPAELVIAEYAARVIGHSGYFKNDISLQFGSGGLSIATARLLQKKMLEQNIVASSGIGGMSGALLDMMNAGLVKVVYDAQDFDIDSIHSLGTNPKQIEVSASFYANPFSACPAVNLLDVAVLSATEIDEQFNVNVLTNSYGQLLGAPGGHPDASAGAKMTVIVMPLLRGRLPMLIEKVHTVVTPGETVDVLVTDYGIAIRPDRFDLHENLRNRGLPIFSIEALRKKAYRLAGAPKQTVFGDRICGIVEYRDGTILDVVRDLV